MNKKESKMHFNQNKMNQDDVEMYINQGNEQYAGCKHKANYKNK